MFDVLWTDPNRELVGERKVRKELEAKGRNWKKDLPGHRSISTSSSSSSDRPLGLFAARNRRIEPSDNGDDGVRPNRSSMFGVTAALANQDESLVSPRPLDGPFLPVQIPRSAGSDLPSHRDSILSKWAQQTAVATGAFDSTSASGNGLAPPTTSETFVQTLGPSSFIFQTKEVSISPRVPGPEADQMWTEVHISSEGSKVRTPPLPELYENPQGIEEAESLSSPHLSPQTPPPVENRHTPILDPRICQNLDRSTKSDAWKPPHEWNCTPTKSSTPAYPHGSLPTSPKTSEYDNLLFPSLAALQREVRVMAAASTELLLANIKSDMGEASDASVYKELEMVKKRWMFSALHQQSGYIRSIDRAACHEGSSTAQKHTRILALYETPASASFLAALYPQIAITHLSPNPISPSLFPNIQPLPVPSISATAASRALPPLLYSTVTCLAIPALFPSTDIPPFLRHISRCLMDGGALHLTIIDPQPISATMGPKLRHWLFQNLLVHLEKAFRTTMPSETFPAWLAVGRLRGKGSTIATMYAPAVPQNLLTTDSKTELHCLVTRMLWQEVWGAFVQAPRWWWEEDEIVQECVEMHTQWQYSYMIALKEAPSERE
ncbi:hypothetical protein F5Y16DRAFT_414312 [Xylariaceae sp. FL0255]|nr:hypothetical protein F5Y16DRAFT_414312 [Xylariaceae sp. FL0255]